jgi:protein-disulfide isomerase
MLAGLLVLVLTAGCKAQNAPPAAPDAVLNRRIETVVRSQYDLPQDVNLTIGARTPSQFNGYQTLTVILSHGAKTQSINFLISSDNKTLTRFDSFDIGKDPADAVNIAGRPIRGNPLAKVTVVNFDDLECPFCARMHQELFPGTMEHYKDLVRYIYKDDPLEDLHPWAMHAAVDANCLAAQSGTIYWAYVDYVHGHVGEVTGEDRDLGKSVAALDRIARQEATVGKLDPAQLNVCLAKQDEMQVRASNKEAEALGLDGTPELYVNGERVNGAVPQDLLWAAIDRALRAAGEQPPPPLPPPAPVVVKPAPAAPAASPQPAPATSK